MILEMLVIEAFSADMHIVNAMHAKNLATLQSYDAVATNFEVAITAAQDTALHKVVITKAAMVPIHA